MDEAEKRDQKLRSNNECRSLMLKIAPLGTGGLGVISSNTPMLGLGSYMSIRPETSGNGLNLSNLTPDH